MALRWEKQTNKQRNNNERIIIDPQTGLGWKGS